MPLDNVFGQLNGLEKPAEISTIEVKTNPVELVQRCFELWSAFLIRMHVVPEYVNSYSFHAMIDSVMQEAISIIKSNGKSIPRVILDAEYYSPIKNLHGIPQNYPEMSWCQFAGLFYTSLLNSYCVDKLVVPSTISKVSFWGYKLRRGVMNINADSHRYIGYNMNGGLLVVDGKSSDVGDEAIGGVIISKGRVNSLCHNANVLCINTGYCDAICHLSKGGLYISSGQNTKSFGVGAKNSICISTGSTPLYWGQDDKDHREPIGISQSELNNDTVLSTLVDDIFRVANRTEINPEMLKAIADNIENHCREHYA